MKNQVCIFKNEPDQPLEPPMKESDSFTAHLREDTWAIFAVHSN